MAPVETVFFSCSIDCPPADSKLGTWQGTLSQRAMNRKTRKKGRISWRGKYSFLLGLWRSLTQLVLITVLCSLLSPILCGHEFE